MSYTLTCYLLNALFATTASRVTVNLSAAMINIEETGLSPIQVCAELVEIMKT